MLWNASALKGYPIKATDGELGTVCDLMYEESNWAIRWVVVDTGDWLSGRLVVLPVAVVGQPDPEAHCVPARLTMKQVEQSVGVDSVRTGNSDSLDCEQENLPQGRDHYIWGHHDGNTPPAIALDPRVLSGATRATADMAVARGDGHVSSISAITGYSIEATDGHIGHAEDFLIDTALWQVRYLIVHTSRWWPSEKLLVSPLSVERIDRHESTIHIAETRQRVKDSPPYIAADTVDGAFEELFHTYYGLRGASL